MKRPGRSTKTSAIPAARSRSRKLWSPPAGAMMSPSTPRAPNASASSRSRSGCSSELPANVRTPRSRATSSMPRCIAEKNGLPTSSTTRPMLADSPSLRRSALAVALWR